MFEKGKPKPDNSGRKPGGHNRSTLLLRGFLEAKNINVVEQIIALMPELSPEAQAKTWLGLMPYLFPRLSSITVEKTPEQEALERLSRDELRAQARSILLKSGEYGKQGESSNKDLGHGPTEASVDPSDDLTREAGSATPTAPGADGESPGSSEET